MVFIEETDNCEKIETLFEQDLKVFGLHRSYKDLGVEFFTISERHIIESLIGNMKNLIDTYVLPSIKEARNEISLIKNENESYKKSEGFVNWICNSSCRKIINWS